MSINIKNTITQLFTSNRNKHKYCILLLTFLFIITIITCKIYWFSVTCPFEETDDAYVAGNQVQIMAQVSGSVTKVWADNTDFVQEGDTLVTLDPTDIQQIFEKTQTQLAISVRQACQQMINSKQLQANIEIQKTALSQAQSNLNRRILLASTNLITQEELQHTRNAVVSAQAQLDMAIQQYNSNQAMIMDTNIKNQPTVKQAAIEVCNAWLALQRTKIVSPITGYVSHRTVQPGTQINSTTPLMAIISLTNLWIDANFKETQLEYMRIGQTATVTSNIYGNDVKYIGKVSGLDMGTDSTFSLLPAQNTNGNRTKVTQRLPIRIVLDTKQLADHPLRIGLSASVKIDTANHNGQVLTNQTRSNPLPVSSNTHKINLDPVNTLINNIIKANTS